MALSRVSLAVSQALRLETAITTTSGTSHDFTGIPSWARRITLSFVGVSLSGTDDPLIQIGSSSGIETTGYLGAGAVCINGPTIVTLNYTTGFGLRVGGAADTLHGIMTLVLVDASTNTWAQSHAMGRSNSSACQYGGGSKSLSAALDRLRVTTTGTNTFDAGKINILIEG